MPGLPVAGQRGTEERCLRGVFDEGTNWAGWVRYPFKPGYSMCARVLSVGEGVEGFRPGDRVFAHAPHCQYFNVEAKKVNLLPEHISDRRPPGPPCCARRRTARGG